MPVPLQVMDVLAALALPAEAAVGQRVPKKLLLENGAPTAADKRQITEGVEELAWVAALKPATVGVPSFRDEVREYLEIAVLSLVLRPTGRATRLAELVHRAIPYPVFLILSQPPVLTLSLAHLRWSQGQSGRMVLDGAPVTAALDSDVPWMGAFLASLTITAQPRQDLCAFYQGWLDRFDAAAAAHLTGRFALADDAAGQASRRAALTEHARLAAQIVSLRTEAQRETQLNRRVALNLELKRLQAQLGQAMDHL